MKIDPASGKPIVELSHSGLATFNSCPKKFAFRKIIANAYEERRETDATAVGSALHDGIQEYMRSRNKMKAFEALILRHPIELYDSSKAATYSVETSLIVLEYIIEHSPLVDYDLAYFKNGDNLIPGTEVAFLLIIELEHLIFHVRGFIDLVLQEPLDNSFFAVDIKTTTAQAMDTLAAKYKWDWQTTSYGIPLNALLGNKPRFRTGIFGVIQSDRTPAYAFPNEIRTTADIEAYQYYLVDSCRRIEKYYRDDMFPRGPNSCITYGKPCFYHDKCGPASLRAMQLLVNPSMEETPDPRPFDPVFITSMEG